jgi:hypothetical protein
MHSRPALVTSAALSLAALSLLVAGCGGSHSPGVASLGPSGTTGTSTTQSGAGSGSSSAGPGSASGSAGGGFGLTMKTQNGARFAACMRSHGIRSFPDPNAQGAISIGPGSGIDPSSAKFQAAQQACRKVLPNGGQPSPQQVAKIQQQALAFSACMRKHGLSDFPDPTFSGGGVQMTIRGGPGSDLNPSSPAFQAAQKACQGLLPGKVATGAAGGK